MCNGEKKGCFKKKYKLWKNNEKFKTENGMLETNILH